MLKLSIIVPIYNQKLHLKKCLDSLSRQSLDSIEFLLIDDGSTDNSGEIAQSYLHDARFQYHKKMNGGLSSARNVGIKLSKGDYISFLDSDDIIHDNLAEHLYSVAVESGADIVSGIKQMFDENIEFVKLDVPYSEIDCLSFIKGAYSCCARLFKRDLFFNSTLMFQENVWCEDNAYVPYLASIAKRIVFSPNVLYGYRRTGFGSLTYAYRTIADAPVAINYLFSICNNRKILVYTAFTTMNNAILNLPYGDRDRIATIKKFSSTPEFKKLFENLSKIIKIFDVNFILGRQKLYFFPIYFFSKGYNNSALVFYRFNSLKKILRKKFVLGNSA